MTALGETLERRLRHYLPELSSVRIRAVWGRNDEQLSEDVAEAAAALAGAHFAAATGAAEAATTSSGLDERERKRLIDGTATTRAEGVYGLFRRSLVVAAGEGPRDEMPGATWGQHFGAEGCAEPLMGVFDYVDGTTLAARGIDGALSLGAVATSIRPVPDLQAYCILLPPSCASLAVDLFAGTPETKGVEIVRELARRRAPEPLRVLTHSPDTGPFHDELVAALRSVDGIDVVVPDPVIVEPNYLFSLARIGGPPIDTMIGVFGLSEMVFASALLDLFGTGWKLVLRPASLGPGADSDVTCLAPFFTFSAEELDLLEAAGLDAERQYGSDEIVPPASALAAVAFPVTDNPLLRLARPVVSEASARAEGLLAIRATVFHLELATSPR